MIYNGGGGVGVREQPSAGLPHGPGERGRDEETHGMSPFVTCLVVQDPRAQPKGTVPAPGTRRASPSSGHHQVDLHFVGHQYAQHLLVHAGSQARRKAEQSGEVGSAACRPRPVPPWQLLGLFLCPVSCGVCWGLAGEGNTTWQ